MFSKERVIRAMEFRNPDRVPIGAFHYPLKGQIFDYIKYRIKYPDDIFLTTVFYKKKKLDKVHYIDGWGCTWARPTDVGEVIDNPIKDWSGLSSLSVPNYYTFSNKFLLWGSRFISPTKFCMALLPDLFFDRLIFLRGFENLMMDFYLETENIKELLDILTEHSLKLIDEFAKYKMDGVLICDDFGLQDRLMISPDMFREYIIPCYKKMIDRTHQHGMKFILHSCGYIMEVMQDFIDIGLDCFQLDQQDHMGVDELRKQFGGKIAFFSPVDIQKTLNTNNYELIHEKSVYLRETLNFVNGGFIGKVYPQLLDIGATEKSAAVMIAAFLGKKEKF